MGRRWPTTRSISCRAPSTCSSSRPSRGARATTEDALHVEEGALYPALHRLERRGWIASEWGLSENNRRAKYYELTPPGRAQLQAQSASWARYSAAVGKVLAAAV